MNPSSSKMCVFHPRRGNKHGLIKRQLKYITWDHLLEVKGLPMYKAARALRCCVTTLKKICRMFGIDNWSSFRYQQNQIEEERIKQECHDKDNMALAQYMVWFMQNRHVTANE